MRDVLRNIAKSCRKENLKPPSRATLYKLINTLPGSQYEVSSLPSSVKTALYNLGGVERVPAHQLAFYCFNYGDLKAACLAAGLPWLALYQAGKLSGWRLKNRGLLDAVLHVRGI